MASILKWNRCYVLPVVKNLSLRVYCAPFVVFLLFFGVIDLLSKLGIPHFAFSKSQYWVFPVQTLVCGALLLAYWRHYQIKAPRRVIFSLAMGVLVFCLWISPQEFLGRPPRLDGFDPTVFPPGSPAYWGTLGMRFLRLAVVVPLIEEIFWRGFLLRYLINEDFKSVPFGTFSWFSFSVVTVCFTLEHQPSDYAAAFVTGILFNVVAVRTRSLSACILAHSITNLLLGFYIMATRQWGFW